MSTMPYITIIQKLTTDWGKQSRGAPGAIQRNATPEAVDIPLEQNKKGRYPLLEQSLMFYESAAMKISSQAVESIEPPYSHRSW